MHKKQLRRRKEHNTKTMQTTQKMPKWTLLGMNKHDKTINIIQHNVNKSRDRVMHALNRTMHPDRHHIIAIQELWRNPKMCSTLKPPNYHLIYPEHTDTRVCFYFSKRLNVLKWDAKEHSPDLITLTLHLKHQDLHIHNCYNQPPKLATSHVLGVLHDLPLVLSKAGERFS